MRKTFKEKIGIFCILCIAIGSIFTAKEAGWLQTFEWMIFDLFVQVRPQEPVDRRIVIVALEEADIKSLRYPVSDRILANLLNKIKSQKPTAIGLDIYRDIPVLEGHAELVKVFKTTPNLIGIQKVGLDEPIPPPPTLKSLGQVSAVDVLYDGDRKLRRVLLYPQAKGGENIPNLGLALAYKYLEKQGIMPQYGSNDYLQLKETVFIPLQEDDGGYSNTDSGSYQMLINYRGPSRSFVTVSFSDVLNGKISPNLMQDRIVLVGANAESVKDIFFTPYSQNLLTTPDFTSGVEVKANVTSQIIASVLDGRPLFRFLPEKIEYIVIVFLIALTIILIWIAKPDTYKDFSSTFVLKLFLVPTFIIILVVGFSYLAFLNSFWLPVFLPISQLVVSSLVLVGYIYFDQIKLTNTLLEQKNKELSKKQVELEVYNIELEEKTLALQESETRLILALDAARTAIWDWDLIEDEIYILHNCSYLLGWGNDSERISFDTFLTQCVCEENCMSLGKEVTSIINDAQDCEFEFQVNRQYGNVRWLAVKGKVFYDSTTAQATRMLGVLSDITERKMSEKKAVLVEGKYSALTTNSFEIPMIIEESLDICYLPPSLALKRILGYVNEEIYGKNILDLVHPQDVSLFIQAIEEIFSLPGSITRIECRWLHSDSSWHILESIVYNCLQNPSIGAFVINSRDVTEYNQMKKALQDLENSTQ